MKKVLLVNVLLLFMATSVFSQKCAIDKYSTIISMTGSCKGSFGDLFGNSHGKWLQNIVLSPAANVFIFKNVFVGGGFEYSHFEQYSSTLKATEDFQTTSIGPNLGYVFGDSESNMYPFVTSGIRYYVLDDSPDDLKSKKGTDVVLGGGVIILGSSHGHLGIVLDATYHFLNLKQKGADKSETGNMLNVGIGIAGLIF